MKLRGFVYVQGIVLVSSAVVSANININVHDTLQHSLPEEIRKPRCVSAGTIPRLYIEYIPNYEALRSHVQTLRTVPKQGRDSRKLYNKPPLEVRSQGIGISNYQPQNPRQQQRHQVPAAPPRGNTFPRQPHNLNTFRNHNQAQPRNPNPYPGSYNKPLPSNSQRNSGILHPNARRKLPLPPWSNFAPKKPVILKLQNNNQAPNQRIIGNWQMNTCPKLVLPPWSYFDTQKPVPLPLQYFKLAPNQRTSGNWQMNTRPKLVHHPWSNFASQKPIPLNCQYNKLAPNHRRRDLPKRFRNDRESGYNQWYAFERD